MKLRLILIAALLGLLPASIFADAPVFPASLDMLKSQAALRAYAISQVTAGSISLNDTSELPETPNLGYITVTGTDADDVVKKLGAAQLSIHVANNLDRVYANADLRGADGQSVAGGSAELKVIPTPSGNRTIDPTSKIVLDVYDWVRIPVGPDVNGAWITYRDDNGNVQWFDYNENVWGGFLYFQGAYATKNGELVLTHRNTNGDIVSSQAYSLSGTPITPTAVSGSVGVSLLNFRKSTDQSLAPTSSLLVDMFPIVPQGSTNQKGAPVVLVQLSLARSVMAYCAVKDSAAAAPWQYSKKVWYRSLNESTFHSATIAFGQYTSISLPAGTYIFAYDLDCFQQMPTSPYYGSTGPG